MIANTVEKTRRNPWSAEVAGISKDGKTAKVQVSRMVVDERYGKRRVRSSVLLVDTNGKSVKTGDKVQIVPCRRISKKKSWQVL